MSPAQAMHREVNLVRNGVELFDASPLGKIELVGPDALEFADRFYINNLVTLKTGKTRHGIMLRENGVVFDDGAVVIVDDDRGLLTTTSSGANRVFAPQYILARGRCVVMPTRSPEVTPLFFRIVPPAITLIVVGE